MIAKTLTAFVATGLGFALIDSVWLITMSTRLYKPEIGEMMAPDFRLVPAIIFYLLYITGILIFAVRPALAAGNWQVALVQGALFGFFCYMTYDMTNYATLRVWSLKVTLLDLVWGTFLTGSAATVGTLVTQKFFPN
ncbi:MAG: DUF2177 family protein [Sandarakinorhabdus sp.]|nr:DUF2177 family protein [Sandarakinorhabdus sp.]